MPGQDSPKVEVQEITTRDQCWEHALHTWGTGFIFERRSQRLRRNLRLLNFLGIAIFVVVGSVVISFGTKSAALAPLIWVAGALAVAQLIFSVWSLISNWNESLAYAVESARGNYRFAVRYEELGRRNPPDLETRFEILTAERQAREDQDLAHDITEKEQRMGLRAALRRRGKECVACKLVPLDMRPTDCPVCGNF